MAVGIQEVRQYIALQAVMNVFITIIPGLRFYILRHRTRNTIGLASDLLFGFAWLLSLGLHWFDIKIANDEYVIRQHTDSEMVAQVEHASIFLLKWEFAEIILHAVELWCIKAAFLCFYWNLSAHMKSKTVRYSLHATAALLAITFAIMFGIFVGWCNPISLNWNIPGLTTHGFCSPDYILVPQILWLVFVIITDVLILAIPLLVINSLNLTNAEKRVVPLVFVMGIVSMAAPMIRFFVNLEQGLFASTTRPVPVTLQQYHSVILLSYLEELAAFIAFSLPSFKFLLTNAYFCGKVKKRISKPFSRVRVHSSQRWTGSDHGQQQIGSEVELSREDNGRRSRASEDVESDAEVEMQIVVNKGKDREE